MSIAIDPLIGAEVEALSERASDSVAFSGVVRGSFVEPAAPGYRAKLMLVIEMPSGEYRVWHVAECRRKK